MIDSADSIADLLRAVQLEEWLQAELPTALAKSVPRTAREALSEKAQGVAEGRESVTHPHLYSALVAFASETSAPALARAWDDALGAVPEARLVPGDIQAALQDLARGLLDRARAAANNRKALESALDAKGLLRVLNALVTKHALDIPEDLQGVFFDADHEDGAERIMKRLGMK